MTPTAGHLIAGKYRLVRPLAAGGMGAVWVASHTELEVDVAIKFMVEARAASEHGRTRFKREARAAARLRTPHVAHIYDYGVENGMPSMVMELLEGEDLWQRLALEGTLDF